MLTHSGGAAWRQACITIASVAIVAAAVAYCAVRPFDRDTLAIQVAQLRSQGAEAALAARLLRADSLAPGFVRIHARQLARKVGSVGGQLRAHPAGALEPARRDAAAMASRLRTALRRDPPSSPAGSEAAYAAMAAGMDALHARLKPED